MFCLLFLSVLHINLLSLLGETFSILLILLLRWSDVLSNLIICDVKAEEFCIEAFINVVISISVIHFRLSKLI